MRVMSKALSFLLLAVANAEYGYYNQGDNYNGQAQNYAQNNNQNNNGQAQNYNQNYNGQAQNYQNYNGQAQNYNGEGQNQYANNNMNGYNNQMGNDAGDYQNLYDNGYGYYNQYYNDEEEMGKMTLINNCEGNSVIEVTEVSILCDTPYDNGYNSHRSSKLCDYGDKALVSVYFTVEETWLSSNNDGIYLTMGVYANKQEKELVWAMRSVDVCNDLVGHECTQVGNYAFAFVITMDYGQMSDRNEFVPQVEMGFSNMPNDGYNLGGANIDCVYGGGYQPYDPWFVGHHKSHSWPAGVFATRHGLLVGALLLVTFFGIFVYKRKGDQIEFTGNAMDEDLVDQKKPDTEA